MTPTEKRRWWKREGGGDGGVACRNFCIIAHTVGYILGYIF